MGSFKLYNHYINNSNLSKGNNMKLFLIFLGIFTLALTEDCSDNHGTATCERVTRYCRNVIDIRNNCKQTCAVYFQRCLDKDKCSYIDEAQRYRNGFFKDCKTTN